MIKKILFVLFISLSSSLFAEESFWELGVGATAVQLPLYPGSAQHDNFAIPFPLFRIQTEYFEIDEGVRGFFYESPDVRLNVSGDFGVPVNSQDSAARAGMPDLDTVLQVGPSLEIIFAGGRKKPSEFRLELPLRMAVATDIKHVNNLGWIFEPRLTYETLRPHKSGFAYQVSSGLRYAEKDFNAFYYDVPLAFATPQRSEYETSGGYNGYFLDLVGNWREDNLIYFAFARYQNLSGTEFEDSPLVEDNNYFSVGVGVIWIFMGSHIK